MRRLLSPDPQLSLINRPYPSVSTGTTNNRNFTAGVRFKGNRAFLLMGCVDLWHISGVLIVDE
jgi:hypothetical protein